MKFLTSFSLGLVATTFFAVLQPATAEITYLDNCNTATDEADKCCFGGNNPCHSVGVWHNGEISPSNATFSKGSCRGEEACFGAAGWGGNIEVGSDSCTGLRGCFAAATAAGFAVVGDGSCIGNNACEGLGRDDDRYALPNVTVSAIVGHGSCLGWLACSRVGMYGTASVGTNSCIGDKACGEFGKVGYGIIGDNSCRGGEACVGMGVDRPGYARSWRGLRIGHNSCNCDTCCTCLKNDEAVNVPDDSCNKLETDSSDPQCCKDESTKGSLSMTDVVNVIPTLPGGWSGGAVATTSISVAPSMSPSLVPSASLSPSTPSFNLEDYTLPDPVCALTGDDNVKCDFSNIVPTAGNLEYSITSFENCTGTNPDTSAISLPSEVTRATAINGTDSVTIDLTTNFELANGASKAYEFCLLTTLNDDNGNMMIYQGQKINTTFVADGGFTVSSITSEKYEGINDETNTNTKTFGVTATRCDINRNPVSNTSPLAIGATLFICIDPIDADKAVVIKSVDTFGAKKGNGAFTDLLSGNTDAQGVGTAAVIIGTRPFASFFADTTPLDISGTVTLEVTENNDAVRRLSARILQSGETDEFELQVELEAVEESSARPSTAFGVAGTALVAGAVAAVATM